MFFSLVAPEPSSSEVPSHPGLFSSPKKRWLAGSWPPVISASEVVHPERPIRKLHHVTSLPLRQNFDPGLEIDKKSTAQFEDQHRPTPAKYTCELVPWLPRPLQHVRRQSHPLMDPAPHHPATGWPSSRNCRGRIYWETTGVHNQGGQGSTITNNQGVS